MVSIIAWVSVLIIAIGYHPTGMIKVNIYEGKTVSASRAAKAERFKNVTMIAAIILLFIGTVIANWGW